MAARKAAGAEGVRNDEAPELAGRGGFKRQSREDNRDSEASRPSSQADAIGGPVDRLELIGGALCTPSLSAADCAVLFVICQHVNHRSGLAWPSINRMTQLTRRDRSTVIRSLSRLIEAGLIAQARRGTQTTSTQYRVSFGHFARPPVVVAPTPLGVVAPTHPGSGAHAPDVVAPTPPELINEPGSRTRVSVDEVLPSGAGAPSGAAGRAGGLAAPAAAAAANGRRFPEFWAAYPTWQTNGVSDDEAIAMLLDAGRVTLPELVSGASRYAAYQAQVNPRGEARYCKRAASWLSASGWLESYPSKPPSKAPGEPQAARTAPKASAAPHRAALLPRPAPDATREQARRAAKDRHKTRDTRGLRCRIRTLIEAAPARKLERLAELVSVLGDRAVGWVTKNNAGGAAGAFTDAQCAQAHAIVRRWEAGQ